MNEKKLLNPNEPADFTPSQNSYETTNKVSPFRMFCYENFPFIDAKSSNSSMSNIPA